MTAKHEPQVEPVPSVRALAQFVAEFIREDCYFAAEVSELVVLDALATFGITDASHAFMEACEGVESA